MLGVFLERATLAPDDLDFSALEAALPRWRWHETATAEQVAERVADADVVVVNKLGLGEAHFAGAPALKLVCVAATGTDQIDLDAARTRGIVVCNVRDYGSAAVAQHVIALLFALYTRLPDYQRAVAQGRWQRSPHFCLLDYPIREVAGSTLGVVGFGALGRAVAQLARSCGMQVLVAERRGRPPRPGRVDFDALLSRVDALTLHCPLTDETRGLIGAAELSRLRPGAVLINAARGGVVDEAALAAALRAGTLAGAGVDVLSTEPPGDDNPLLDAEIPNLIVTPHVAWGSRPARQRIVDQLVDNIRAYLAGSPRNVVT
jgi:glycerate dehydrogenase